MGKKAQHPLIYWGKTLNKFIYFIQLFSACMCTYTHKHTDSHTHMHTQTPLHGGALEGQGLSTMCFMIFANKFCLSDPEASNFTIPALLLTPDLLCLLFICLNYILLKSHTFIKGILQCLGLKNLIFKVHACIHCVLISTSPFVLLQFLPFPIPSLFSPNFMVFLSLSSLIPIGYLMQALCTGVEN